MSTTVKIHSPQHAHTTHRQSYCTDRVYGSRKREGTKKRNTTFFSLPAGGVYQPADSSAQKPCDGQQRKPREVNQTQNQKRALQEPSGDDIFKPTHARESTCVPLRRRRAEITRPTTNTQDKDSCPRHPREGQGRQRSPLQLQSVIPGPALPRSNACLPCLRCNQQPIPTTRG